MTNHNENFMDARTHFSKLVELMEPGARANYEKTYNARQETAYRGRTLVLYEMQNRDEPTLLEHVVFGDFECDDIKGATTLIRSQDTGKELIIGYEPVQLFAYPVFVFLPLHAKLRWSAVPSDPLNGSLAFPVIIRTLSRMSPREKGVIHCETGVQYAKEFEGFQQ